MRKLLIAAVSVAAMGLAAPASAADMPVKAAPPPAPVVTIYNWSGFYIGANGGWGQSHQCIDFVTLVGTVAGACADRSGGLIGGQIGYRWQTNQFVFGLEAQGDWADIKNTRVSLIDPLISTTGKTDGIGLFTAQLGWAWNASLFYVKGGAAVTHNSFDIFNNVTGVGLASAGHTRWGGALGVGWEYGFAPNWSFGIEYDHLWMGRDNTAFAGVVTPIGVTLLGTGVSQDVDMITLRFNYRFGGYTAPVTARY
ncbi:porin family protein [Bradyrhizobium manausense]|uniref:outer membrane protein n=1 Tax=Bradyrhizobium TaxID=374 RepID=UPI001BA705A8|nr:MULTISPECIES: outer membrane beta-barrel protein [Bradyrhizobium]MBR0828280.1 porin family protein [Bradyrhizobium manausense]UVO25644.1 outer membrane beta-barrel protein [Bradyrhizobium arachidis]